MTCRRMVREPERMDVSWPDGLGVEPWIEDKGTVVGELLHRVSAELLRPRVRLPEEELP